MIKFNQFNVQSTVTGEKAKVWYSLDNRFDGRNCVTIYSKDYNRALGRVFADVGGYKNDTDTQTDYFDKGSVTIYEDSPLYAIARARANLNDAKREAKQAIRDAARAAGRTVRAARYA
jgi:hypothetical protein